MTEQELITELNSFCKYNPETGELIVTSHRRRSRTSIGTAIGTLHSRGYLVVRLSKKLYKVHRLIWLLQYNSWPKHQIDHINGNAADNRLSNLRDVPQAVNLRNRELSSNNTSGVAGVIYHKNTGKWFASIEIDGQKYSLGYHTNFNDAVIARRAAAVTHKFTPRHGI